MDAECPMATVGRFQATGTHLSHGRLEPGRLATFRMQHLDASGFTAYVTTGGSDKALKDSINRAIQCHSGPSQLEPGSPDLTTSQTFCSALVAGLGLRWPTIKGLW